MFASTIIIPLLLQNVHDVLFSFENGARLFLYFFVVVKSLSEGYLLHI